MKTLLLHSVLVAALVGGRAQRSAAQTARIAHLSHSGSLEALDVAADNFGELAPVFEVDSIRFLSDTTTLEYGSWQGHHNTRQDKTTTYQFNSKLWENHVSAQSYVEQSRRYRPQIKVVGYDTLPPMPKPAPVLKKQKTKRKKAVALTMPTPPTHPGVGLAVVAILAFAGAGWLLGQRRPALTA
jgi:hypothetical protein